MRDRRKANENMSLCIRKVMLCSENVHIRSGYSNGGSKEPA